MQEGVLLALGALAAGGLMALIKAASAFFAKGEGRPVPSHNKRAAEQQATNEKATATAEAKVAHNAVDNAVVSETPEHDIVALWNKENT
jgi:hypothetical protein